MKLIWIEAVRRALWRFCERHGRREFSRQEIITEELDQIVKDTGSSGKTPHQTLTWALERLRDLGEVEFVDNRGNYRLLSYRDQKSCGTAQLGADSSAPPFA